MAVVITGSIAVVMDTMVVNVALLRTVLALGHLAEIELLVTVSLLAIGASASLAIAGLSAVVTVRLGATASLQSASTAQAAYNAVFFTVSGVTGLVTLLAAFLPGRSRSADKARKPEDGGDGAPGPYGHGVRDIDGL